jgi:hypothetical protein
MERDLGGGISPFTGAVDGDFFLLFAFSQNLELLMLADFKEWNVQ